MIGCVILLWHSLGLQYNYLTSSSGTEVHVIVLVMYKCYVVFSGLLKKQKVLE